MVVRNAIFLGRAEFRTLADLIEISGIEALPSRMSAKDETDNARQTKEQNTNLTWPNKF